MDQNMNDLMNAAKLKLEAQQKQEKKNTEEDIYAGMRTEMGEDYEVPQIRRNQSGESQYDASGYNIQYESDESYDEYDEEFYIDPNDTPIFEDGPGVSQIELWKKQYSREKIFHTQILDKHFVFRSLNRFEYKQIVAIENIDALHREEVICTTCVLWPYNYDFKTMAAEDSGYPSTLAQIIMENSGFTKEYGIEVL
jgi:hypothetical protein